MCLRLPLLISVIASVLITANSAWARGPISWYVDGDNCPGPGTGTQEDPFCTIRAGINAAEDGDEVVVADGIYTGSGNRSYFEGKGLIVRSANGPKNCVIDCQNQGRAFYIGAGGPTTTQIRGFTIINGYAPYGGGIYAGAHASYVSEIVIDNCIIRDCTAWNIALGGVGGGAIDIIVTNPKITNCTIVNNRAPSSRGGGIFCEGNYATITNCTIAGNSAPRGGGVYLAAGNDTLSNCILRDNTAPNGPQGYKSWSGYLDISHCNVQGGAGSIAVSLVGDGGVIWGDGNIDTEPLFVDPPNNDFHLQAASPCIDAGDNNAVICDVDVDLEPRIGDGDGDEETPGVFATVDMGSDEYHDCNANGVQDYQDIADGTSEDCNFNVVPDECEPDDDCNGNGLQDICDLAEGTSPDCNQNAIPDECDLAEGTSQDCNGNLVPDECDVPSTFTSSSPEYKKFGGGTTSPQSYTIVSPPEAMGDVTLYFRAIADLNGPAKKVDVDINGVPVGTVFETDASFCPETPDEDQLVVPAETYNAAAGSGEVVITMIGSIHHGWCRPERFISVTVEYEVSGVSEDCNGNDIPDECEPDCNQNGMPDDCDLAAGTSEDCNDNDIPDECDLDSGTSPDCNGNGIPDECELTGAPLGQWAGELIDFSSEWSSPDYGAIQALNEPDVAQYSWPLYRDDPRAWAPLLADNPDGEYIIVGFAQSLHAVGVEVVESWRGLSLAQAGLIGPGDVGFVTRVELLDIEGVFHTVWEGVDDSPLQGYPELGYPEPAVFEATFEETPYLVQEVRINLITDRPEEVVELGGEVYDLSDWEEIDAIRLLGLAYQAEDCNGNGVPDECDISNGGGSFDCNDNGIPDECDLSLGYSEDCQSNGIPDECDIAECLPQNPSCQDCNSNDIPDECDIAGCTPEDPSCQDCNENKIPDSCDITKGTSDDCQPNEIPDECEEAPCAICDLNGDVRVDKRDWKIMQRCLSQETPVIPDDCVVADLDGDGQITKIDWKLFVKCYRQYVGPSQIGSQRALAP